MFVLFSDSYALILKVQFLKFWLDRLGSGLPSFREAQIQVEKLQRMTDKFSS